MAISTPLAKLSALIIEWTPLSLLSTYLIFSFFFYVLIPPAAHDILWYIFISVQTLVTFTVLTEALQSIRPNVLARRSRRKAKKEGFPDFPDSKCPHMDIVMVAYLPNEQDIICRQAKYFLRELDYPANKLTINLVYNTPRPIEPVESELVEMDRQYKNLRVIKVTNSTSKADNINHFLELNDTQGEITSIYDTDHYPEPQALKFVARRFLRGDVDIIQGRCCIYNYAESICTRLVAAEFDTIYGVFHPGRANFHGYGLFGGSNGHWSSSLLKSLKMQKHMLTEDIDSSLRAITSGARVVYDLHVLSFETAPETFRALLKQRLRWAQGWTQVTVRHSIPAMKRGAFGSFWRSRFGLFFLLGFRELFFHFLAQLSCLLLSSLLTHFPTSWSMLYSSFVGFKISVWILVLNVLCIAVTTAITIRNRAAFTTAGAILAFGIISPLYFTIVSATSIFGHFREIIAYSNWNPTARSKPKPTG
ncbi:unnamed protein product [Sympodiomycopsis kandeliae]